MEYMSVVKVGHECDTSERENKDKNFFVIRPSLLRIQKWPYNVVDFQYEQK